MNEIFKALNDETRRGILNMLKMGNLTAGEIAAKFSISKPSISHHLEQLKKSDLITSEKRGQFVVYSVNTSIIDDLLEWVLTLKNKKHEK